MGKGKGWHGNTAGHRRAAIKGLIKAGKRPSIFFEPKHKKYAGIITFKSVGAAREAAAEMEREFGQAKRRDKMIRIYRSTSLAANRAEASAKRQALSPKTKSRFRGVARVYRAAGERMRKRLVLYDAGVKDAGEM